MISFRKVSKFILSDINVHIPKGVVVGIIGSSGAGKTTLLKLACGLLSSDRGEVYNMGKEPVKQLSLGQRRRAELAFMLMGNPPLLIFDEPTNGLDEEGKQVFWKQLEQKKEAGATILISSHNMTEIV